MQIIKHDVVPFSICFRVSLSIVRKERKELAATLRWFTAGGTVRVAIRQLLQTWKLRHYDVIDDVIIWVQDGNCKKWLERILVLVRSTI